MRPTARTVSAASSSTSCPAGGRPAAKRAKHEHRSRPASRLARKEQNEKPRRLALVAPVEALVACKAKGSILASGALAPGPSGHQVSAAGGGINDFVFFQTFRGTVLHAREPGSGWSRLCSLKTARASEVFEEVLEMGNFETAKTQGRSFCSVCFGRAGLAL